MNKLNSTIATLVITMSIGLLTGDARADHVRTADELAHSLMRQTIDASREVRYGFRHSPQFRRLYKDVCDMYQTAHHVHEIAHDADNSRHLLNDAQKLDELVDHTQELIDEIAGQGIGHSPRGHQGYGAVNQYHLRRMNRLMTGITATVHELQDVIGYRRPTGPDLQGPPAVIPGAIPPSPVAVPRGPIGRRSGIEFRRSRTGRVSFSLRIR